MSETQPDLREALARFIMEHSTYVVKEQAEWRADALIRGPLAPILAQVSALQAEVERLQKGLDLAADEATSHRNAAVAALRERDAVLERLQKVEGEREKAQARAEKVRAELPEALRDIDLVHAVRELRLGHDSVHRRVGLYAKAIRLMLPFLDMAAGEGLMFEGQESGSPEMDAADICVAVSPLIGCTEPEDSAWQIIREQGWKDIRAARQAPSDNPLTETKEG